MIKTVLAPNAPWPKPIPKTPQKKKGRQVGWRKPPKLDGEFDLFAEAREQIKADKDSKRHGARDKLSGRFTSLRVEG